ncbi:uncharacterized protein MONBRDRAFT_37018 [Monosiga brevicollis MX1]|uniref:Branched-chain-amino-acid aminotransferase n=1 Tax=Monosiga brevicollis TaxID=81824 RepID=BCAT_MONBE|nr:uncharacterized protein MONBRDRAFT_37018 [Monosiga brevicollis MX1]A9UZ24.1 RecName: Full=Branched-chain-amino-acid aminotransferase [Monosiga brevicollis]EDQ89710.1 predicted protein [Monosiga brevicollis MX1]|eukprot:XP_001745739.1 hypothetical protein [Monosiga brevicollis MX1]
MAAALRLTPHMRQAYPVVAAPSVARLSTLDASKLTIETTTQPRERVEKTKLVFGHTFSDHMLKCKWDVNEGWAAPTISPYANLSLAPSSIVLHYAIECFEGMKAFRGDDDRIRLFRPNLNMDRLHRSSVRLALPDFDQDELLKCITELVIKDKDWIPAGRGYSLYLRPTHIGTAEYLGVGKSSSSLLFCINSPSGAYYSTGFKPVSLLADPAYVRAWPGGVGNTKGGCNYAPSIYPQSQAQAQGCQQVLWLFGEDHEVTEVGTMNLFMYWKNEQGEDELITPPLDGTILPGVTRQSIVDMARGWNEFKVSERKFNMGQVSRALKEGRVYEMFGAGTAATVCPIGQIKYLGEDLNVPLALGNSGELTNRIWTDIFDIQYGAVEHEWAPVIA